MTNDALNALWTLHADIRMAELQYWRTADQLLDQGLIDIYDVATIYGVCADTARKRLKTVRGGGHGLYGTLVAPFDSP